ncbi:hypothetical protein [Fibrella aquatilis]|uniref:Uncharacterized protein n=1 Tax=Fibrella aquatilis TaxID=2817059 RepID=A0A939K258_9BACT|nr:hypothetical protein [Fibrella aquatilis]MBO0933761.1 hypothetical protein [Fibrella aquatilis]
MNRVVVVDQSFTITGRGSIITLQHVHQGLAEGTVLKSELIGQCWTVKSRVMFTHLVDKHRFFDNELINYMTLSRASLAKRSEADIEVLKQEQAHMFQYLVQGISHEQQPKVGDSLLVE